MKKMVSLLVILFTISANAQWVVQNSNTNQRLLTIYFLNENLGWAGGDEGCILKTTDGGANWNYFSLGTKYTVHAVYFVDSLKGWAAIYSFNPNKMGYIIATSDGGENWYFQYYANGYTLHNIYFYNQYFGWALGSNGIFLRTINGGASWQVSYPSFQWAWGMDFVSPNVGWYGDGYSGYIRKTTDGGLTWQCKSVPSYSTMFDINFINQNIGWAVGADGNILKSNNGGESWDNQYSSVSYELEDVEFKNEYEGWIVGLGGIVLHTNDGGLTWMPQGSNTTENLFALSFCNSQIGWIAGDHGLILKTDNGGGPFLPVELTTFTANYNKSKINLTWSTATELNNQGFEIQRRTSLTDWFTVGFIDGNGTTSEPHQYSYLDDISQLNINNVYYRLKQMDFNGTFKFSDEIEVVVNPTISLLKQNFPNPFNPLTTIEYDLPKSSFVLLKIYDVLGNEVQTLVDEIKQPGYHQAVFDASNLSSGIYLYTLQTDGYFERKKMLFLK